MKDYLTLPVIAAIAALLVAVIGAVAAGIAVVIRAVHEVAIVTGKIETAVNSEKTAAQGRELTLKNENAILRELVNEYKQTAALLAQAAASRTANRSTDVLPPSPLPVEVVNAPLLVEQADHTIVP